MNSEEQKLINDIALIDKQLELEKTLDAKCSNIESDPCTSQTEKETRSVDYSEVIELNNSCQEVLKMLEAKLLQLLSENREKQKTLIKYLEEYTKKPQPGENFVGVKCLGIPYFKDFHGYPQPRNEYVKERIQMGQLCCMDYFKVPHIWSKSDKDKLASAVSESVSANNAADKSEKSIDWLKISATDMNGKYSATECESQWHLHLCPEINKEKWSDDEINKLNHLAVKYNKQDWDVIAKNLNTNRTGYQCCIKYQMKNSLKDGKWLPEEDEYLKLLVNTFKVGNVIPWSKISWYFETRSRKQCHDRYIEHLQSDLKRGAFSVDEDKIIITGIKIFKDFGKVARFLPGRQATQIRSRYYYLIGTAASDFNKQEDDLLVSLVDQYRSDWNKISTHFDNHTRLQCRQRFAALCNKNASLKRKAERSKSASRRKRTKTSDSVDTEETKAHEELLKFHEFCSENYFGPRIKNPTTDDELNQVCTNVKALMTVFNISSDLLEKSEIIRSLNNDCNFSSFDKKVLERLSEMAREDETSDEDNSVLRGNLIPPNSFTLAGYHMLTLSKHKIKNNTYESEGFPSPWVTNVSLPSSSKIGRDFEKAKWLFEERLKALFFLPAHLSHVPTSEMDKEFFHKAKTKKPKKLSRKRLKIHAKNMCKAYAKKKEEKKLAETKDQVIE